MKRSIFLLLFFMSMLLSISCYEKLTSNLTPNSPPKTFVTLFPDTAISQQLSNLHLHWWGDDPDGLIVGYYFTWDNVHWTFTTKNDSVIAFPLVGGDTVYYFKVAAVDNFGNGVYDNAVFYKGLNLGAEPFTDKNGNGKWDAGEPYIDLGVIDPNPASVKLPIKNSPPVLSNILDSKGQKIEVPESTYTVATFGWNASDVDGESSIISISIALNDSTQTVDLPGYTRLVTLIARPPFTGNTVDCDIYLGSALTSAGKKISGLKLNGQNVLYVFAKDIASATSVRLKFPSTANKWYVRKPTGSLLVIDDYAPSDKSGTIYKKVLDSLGFSSDNYDVWDIKSTGSTGTAGALMPKFIREMFTETLKLYKAVFWYTDNQPTLEAARIAVKSYAGSQSTGKIFLSMLFPSLTDSTTITDILPLEIGSTKFINDGFYFYEQTKILPTTQGSAEGWPQLLTDGEDSPITYIRGYYPSNIGSYGIYKIDFTDGQPTATVGLKSTDGRIVFIGLPLAYCNGSPFNLKALFRKVIIQEFGVAP